MSLSIHTAGSVEHDYFARVPRYGNTFAFALMFATGAVATFDLYLFAATAIR